MSQQIEIRQASATDWPKILALYQSLDTEDLEFRFMTPHQLSVEEAKEIAFSSGRETFLAINGEDAIGEASLEEDGEISVVVSRKFREEGVAMALVRHLVDAARTRGLKHLKFYCLPGNLHMIRLGKVFGFRVLGQPESEDEWILDLV